MMNKKAKISKTKNLNQNLIKGNKLEKAVEFIEKAIFKENPLLNQANISIEPKKIIIVNDVKYEIDLFVQIKTGDGYDSITIFECKNWDTESIDAKEVTFFNEKIDALGAQKGYFIGKTFSKHALAKAKEFKRIEILKVKDYLLDPTFSLPDIVKKGVVNTNFFVEFKRRNINAISEEISLEQSHTVNLNGQEIILNTYIKNQIDFLINKKLKEIDIDNLPLGIYDYKIDTKIDYPQGTFIFNDYDIESCKLKIEFTYQYESCPPKIISRFDVEKRGRFLHLEVNDQFKGKVHIYLSAKE